VPAGVTTTRAVVLARGLGTRMQSADAAAQLTDAQRRAADAGLKALMPIGGRAFLDYLLSALADAGIGRVALVVAPDHRAVRAHYDAHPPRRLDLALVVQPEARGTADAVAAAETWTAGQPFLAMNADNLYPAAALTALASIDEPGFAAFDADDLVRTGNIPAERIRAFAIVDVDETGYLSEIVEKPAADRSTPGAADRTQGAPGFSREKHGFSREKHGFSRNTPRGAVSMNLWRLDHRIFPICRDVPPSVRGEQELPEAVALAVRRGIRFRAVPASGPVLDLSRRADAPDVERRLAGVVPQP
jgi:glucose-1-phosphate thymidylyltransferase